MKISAIAGIQESETENNWGIGYDDKLLYRISDDLKNFKQVRLGKPIIMGRNTWKTLGRPLPDSLNIVLSKTEQEIEGVVVFPSLHEALQSLQNHEEVLIIGGGMVYKESLPLLNQVYLSFFSGNKPANVFFPKIDLQKEFSHTIFDGIKKDEKSGIDYRYVVAEKK